MSTLEVASKACTRCGETKPLSEFYRNRNSRDGHHWECKDCSIDRVRESQERRRSEMGDEAFRRHQKVLRDRSRSRTGNARGRRSQAAYTAALFALRDRHRDEFDALLSRERYERGLT